MEENKNIDRLFQEKFKDFDIAPNDALWDRISGSLPKKKKKRRVIAWWQIGGIAAAIVLFFTAGIAVFNVYSNALDQPKVVTNEESNTATKNRTLNSNNNVEPSDISPYKSKLDNTETTAVTGKNVLMKKALHQSNTSKNTIVNSLTKPQPQKKDNTKGFKNNTLSTAQIEQQSSKNEMLKYHNDEEIITSKISQSIKKKTSALANNFSGKEKVSNNSNSDIDNQVIERDVPLKESLLDAIVTQEDLINEKEKEDESSRWGITPNVAPVYFNSLGEGSSIDAQFNQNTKRSAVTMSYGITGTYEISKKLKLRTGINNVNLSQKTANVLTFANGEFASRDGKSMANITMRDGMDNVTLMSGEIFNRGTTPETFNTKSAGSIEQRLGFIEVPVELEYRLVDHAFGLNVVGGFSTFFLNQNEIYADINGAATLVGEANNINSTSFSANIGLGLDYNITKQLYINLEPQFKYQINTFNNTAGNFRPFFIGIYTGLRFKF